MTINKATKSVIATCLLLSTAGIPAMAKDDSTFRVEIESSTAIFDATTKLPGVEVKGKSCALRGRGRARSSSNCPPGRCVCADRAAPHEEKL